MTKRLALALVALATLLALSGAPAAAQDEPAITLDPASVDEPGEYEFTITGTGWTVESLLVLPCIVVEDLTMLDAAGGDCDLANLNPATVADGGFEITATFNVPAEGVLIVAGTNPPSETAFAIVIPGAEAEAAEEEPAEEEAAAEEESSGEEEELANTGVESGMLAIAAGAVLAGGLMLTATQRRRTA